MAVLKRIQSLGETSLVGQWWRRLTPTVVRKALSRAANAMLYLFDHPWVQWMAL